jgi:NO-binding membrane sensor protein with MHYT domain
LAHDASVHSHLNQFSYGTLTPIMAYLFSFLGCLVGLKATDRARLATNTGMRARWLVLAAWAIGGTGIWVMHFVAMLGFTADGMEIRYDLPLTLASWLTAIIVVGSGLFVVGTGRPSAVKVVIAGVFTGLGVAAMHYTGMYAMQIDGKTSYSEKLVGISVGIAVVASIVALWFTIIIRRTAAVIVAAAIMAVAVCSMHFTGMYALTVSTDASPRPLNGVVPFTLLVPIFAFVLICVVALGYGMLNSPSERDVAQLDELQSRLTREATVVPQQQPGLGSAFRLPTDTRR